MAKRLFSQLIGLAAGAALVIGVLAVTGTDFGVLRAQDAPAAPLAISQVLQYQGRLLDPGTGDPKEDAGYPMTFNIYNAVSGGTALWTESKTVAVSNGLFSTLLGDTTTLNLGDFNGQELYLGVSVNGDPEAAPRQRLAHVAYAMFAQSVADNAVDSAKIVNESVGDSDIRNTIRTISFPANALNYDKTSTIISQYATGLRWQANFQSPAYLNIPAPSDWDGSSDVDMRLYFLTTTAATANVQFFIRPRAFDPGETFIDAASMNGTAVKVSRASEFGIQLVTIPASRFGRDQIWVITIQRQGAEETYPHDVVLTAVSLSYTAVR